MADAGRRGPTEDRGVAMDRIVTVARASFADHGWAGTSMRAVARDAGVDSRLVAYYFADKSALLQACVQPPPGYLEGIAAVLRTPLRRRGAALVRNLLAAWNNPATATVLRSIILTAAHKPVVETSAAFELAKAVRAQGIATRGGRCERPPDLAAFVMSDDQVGQLARWRTTATGTSAWASSPRLVPPRPVPASEVPSSEAPTPVAPTTSSDAPCSAATSSRIRAG